MNLNKELQTLNERIAERIGKELVDLMPPDQWQKLVDTAIVEFKEDTAPKIIHQLITEKYTEKAKGIVDKLTSSIEWNTTTQEFIYSDLERFIGKSSGNIFAAMLTPAMQMALQDMKNRLGY